MGKGNMKSTMVAKLLGYSYRHVANLLREGKIKATKVNGDWEVDIKDLRDFGRPLTHTIAGHITLVDASSGHVTITVGKDYQITYLDGAADDIKRRIKL